jgi:4-amino-4-deoxy-L-arabinose transferase
MFSYFTTNQIIPLIISAIIIVLSIITFSVNKEKIALILLFIGSLVLGFFIANLDHFLMIWDEQYHALVAKNMINNPFKPMLYSNPLLEYDFRGWSGNHIWLHKQPLFLWQIALSLKLFGVNELALRVPSIILHSFLVLFTYRIGKITYSSTVGFYGALFFAVAYYPLELVAGRYSTDHNDVAFLFYVTASFWSWFEYKKTNKSYWLILIGLFAGCAVLVKWLTGMIIYAIWTISLGSDNKKNWVNPKAYIPILISFLISLLTFIPWQIYILCTFPLEAKYEFQLNSEHFFKAIEGHSGDFWFHFNAIKDIYGSGDIVPFLLILGVFLLLKKATNRTFRIAIISALIITYGFFSLAATKMTSFCIIVSPFIFLGLGALTDFVLVFLISKIKFIKVEQIIKPILLILFAFSILNLSKIQNRHTDSKPKDNNNNNNNRKVEENEISLIKKLPILLGNDKYVIFYKSNRVNAHIQIMFYTDYISYDFIPTIKQIELVKKQHYKIAVLNSITLPEYIKNDTNIVKLYNNIYSKYE